MKLARAACGLVLVLTGALLADETRSTLSLVDARSGVEILRRDSASPDDQGIIHRYALALPEYDVGCYWQARPGPWYHGTNHMRPKAFQQPGGLAEGGFFLVLRLKAGDYLAVLPLAGSVTMSWLSPEPERFVLNVGNLGTARVKGPFPAAAWARAKDPYTACREVWAQAMKVEPLSSHIQPRGQKELPEFIHYLGFATWEEYRENYDAAKLLDMMRRIHSSGLPIRWIQIGMGHHDSKALGENRLLNSFEPNPAKFPEGWKPVMAARKEDGIKWLGLFQALSGLPNGIHPENSLGDLNRYLMPVPSGVVQPRNDPAAAAAFYDAMLAAVKRNGLEFIKMDFESNNIALYMGTPNPVEAAVNNQRAYQAAAAKYLRGNINCMAHYAAGIFNTGASAMTRMAEDYHNNDPANAREILYTAYGNLPWAGQTVWGDHDMFHSSDTVSNKMMAVAKAMSGGTVYLSDRVDTFMKELIFPLAYRDGRILRPLAPAAPLPESLFIRPAQAPFRVVAPLPNATAAVVVYNLTDPLRQIDGFVRVEDYADASIMMQPYPGKWAQPREGILVYDWRERKAQRLNGTFTFALHGFEDRFLLLCPIQDGWAVVGRTDKYLSPAAVEVVTRSRDELVLRMRESGPLAVWAADGTVSSKDAPFRPASGGLWFAELPIGIENMTVQIARRGRHGR